MKNILLKTQTIVLYHNSTTTTSDRFGKIEKNKNIVLERYKKTITDVVARSRKKILILYLKKIFSAKLIRIKIAFWQNEKRERFFFSEVEKDKNTY